MNRSVSEKIIQNFDFKVMETLNEYITDRVEYLHNRLERESDPDIFRQLQGQIQELRYLTKIRDYAVSTISLKE
jgi:hypothetical protein